jgi:hypothetical protein
VSGRDATGPELDALWDEAREAFKQRRPRVIRRPFGDGLFSRDEVFGVFPEASRGAGRGVNLWRDGGLVAVDKGDLLPRPSEQYDDYIQRAERNHSPVDLQIYLQDVVHLFGRGIWHKVREVARAGIRELGVPPGGVGATCFFGRYHRTGDGIHFDSGDYLSFVVVGPKKMIFWPREAFPTSSADELTPHRTSGTARFEEHMDGAICLEAGTGDVICWPREYWHIAVSDGLDWALTLNVGFFFTPISVYLDGLLFDPRAPSLFLNQKAASLPASPTLPGDFVSELEHLRGAVQDPDIEAILHIRWLRMLSAKGFHETPAPAEIELDETARVRRGSEEVFFWEDEEEVVVVCDGHTLGLPLGTPAKQLVEAMRAPGAREVSPMLAELAVAPEPGRELVAFLLGTGGLSFADG